MEAKPALFTKAGKGLFGPPAKMVKFFIHFFVGKNTKINVQKKRGLPTISLFLAMEASLFTLGTKMCWAVASAN